MRLGRQDLLDEDVMLPAVPKVVSIDESSGRLRRHITEPDHSLWQHVGRRPVRIGYPVALPADDEFVEVGIGLPHHPLEHLV